MSLLARSTVWLVALAWHYILATQSSQIVEYIAVPHDIHPGYCIKRLDSDGDRTFTLLQTEFSGYFSILKNGSLTPLSNISHLTGSSVTLVVEEESVNGTTNRTIVLHIVDRMFKFDKATYRGSVSENQPAGSLVSGLEKLSSDMVDQNFLFKFSFISGNNRNSFRIDKSYEDSNFIQIFTNTSLDRELQKQYHLVLQAVDLNKGIVADVAVIVDVLNVNDNAPVPRSEVFNFKIPHNTQLHSVIGNVNMVDADGDQPIYYFTRRHAIFDIVPKTGDIILMGEPDIASYSLSVRAHDNQNPPQYSTSVSVFVEVFNGDLLKLENPSEEIVEESNATLPRFKREMRVKKYLYKETDGSVPGRTVFQLERNSPDETFELELPNLWVDVENSGTVKVKKPWDYEQLGEKKTIDFWVLVTGNMTKEPKRRQVIIFVRDVNDENPYFVNSPMPMQAVVQLDAPWGTQVFKLQAKDPDSDHNIHYFLVRDYS